MTNTHFMNYRKMYEPQYLSGSKLQDDLMHLSVIKTLVVVPNRKYVFVSW